MICLTCAGYGIRSKLDSSVLVIIEPTNGATTETALSPLEMPLVHLRLYRSLSGFAAPTVLLVIREILIVQISDVGL